MDFVEPSSVDQSIGRLIFHWRDYDLRVVADRLTDTGKGELWFYHLNGKRESLLHAAQANLLSTVTMAGIARRMGIHSQEIPWQQLLTFICARTLEYSRRGEPGCIIEPSGEDAVHPGYYLEPFVTKGVANVIYGEMGVSKTTLCLAFLGIMSLGDYANGLGLKCTAPCKVGLLDWEGTQPLTDYTLRRLIQGSSISWFALPYLPCRQTVAENIQHIANFIHAHQLGLIMIDSLGQAAGSDRYDSAGKGAALKFFEVLRQLDVTSLIIGQTAKNEEGKRTIYGSAFFSYYARNIFQLKAKQDELDENTLHVSLSHEKSNYSQRYRPIGFSLRFTDKTIKIEPEEVSVAEFYERASITNALLNSLKSGAKSRQDIATLTGKSAHYCDSLLGRLKTRGLVIQIERGVWGLATKEQT